MAEKSPFRTSDPWLNCCLQVNALIDLFRSICVFAKLPYMYGPPSDCKEKAEVGKTSLRKCIRPSVEH